LRRSVVVYFSGGWSTDGCELISVDSSVVSCSCSHLTNFAILISPSPAVSHPIHSRSQILLLVTAQTHSFNGPLSGTTQVSRYQKGETNLDFTEARDSKWQWHQLGHMQVCTLLQTDNHASTLPLSLLQAGCPSCRPSSNVKALKAMNDGVLTAVKRLLAASRSESSCMNTTRRSSCY